jgi:hypothetical protein
MEINLKLGLSLVSNFLFIDLYRKFSNKIRPGGFYYFYLSLGL